MSHVSLGAEDRGWPVLDDFDRALLEISKSEATELSKGVELIKNKLFSTLEQKGLEFIEVKACGTINLSAFGMISSPRNIYLS